MMHPYITQTLMNERVADMQRRAAASRLARQARHEARATRAATHHSWPIPAVPRQARREAASLPVDAAGPLRSTESSRQLVGSSHEC
jgi:uncharacterized membrane protein